MSQMVLEIPNLLAELPPIEMDRLIRGGLYEAVRARIRQLKKEIAESKEHLHDFEERYGVSFAQFETTVLPELDTLQAHEDYNDWPKRQSFPPTAPLPGR
ncbi:MAG: hypothetical protein MAG431_00705 [Chloroflexi bacterium]|nr:hypothetical protein [Chloroflexota bacterium]